MEELFDKLRPPPCVEVLEIDGYLGSRLPAWMMTTSVASLGSLRNLMMKDLSYCTELPASLCQLPNLELLQITNAPLIMSIGPEFLEPHNHEHLSSTMENLCSVVELVVIRCPGLMRICNLPKTEELSIGRCPNVKVLEGMSTLPRLVLEDYEMKMLPGYLRHVNPIHLLVDCDVSLLTTIAFGKYGPEWDKFCHIRLVEAYAHDNTNNFRRKWYVKYTRNPFSFKTNIGRSQISQARKRMVLLTYHGTCPIDEQPTAGHACMDKCQPLCQHFRCNAYRRLVPWLWKVCLHCCEAQGIAVSSNQWTEGAVCFADTKIVFELTCRYKKY